MAVEFERRTTEILERVEIHIASEEMLAYTRDGLAPVACSITPELMAALKAALAQAPEITEVRDGAD